MTKCNVHNNNITIVQLRPLTIDGKNGYYSMDNCREEQKINNSLDTL